MSGHPIIDGLKDAVAHAKGEGAGVTEWRDMAKRVTLAAADWKARAERAEAEAARLRERVDRMRRYWIADAEAALAGDLGPLRTRVGLCKMSIDELRSGNEQDPSVVSPSSSRGDTP